MLSAFRTLFLSLGFSLLGQLYFAEAGEVNITVDDTDSSIIYEPTTAWFFSGNASGCTVCSTPPSVAYNNTWHQGLHILPTPSVNNTDSASRRKRSEGVSAEPSSKRRNDPSGERRVAPDPSRDVPVSVQFNFTGSAIYLYSIPPLGKLPNADSTPTLMNLTFTFDSEPAGNFFHSASSSATNQSSISVFSQAGLSDSTHTLLVNLGPNSVFLFDYYVVSRADCSDSNPCPTHSQASTKDAHKLPIRSIAGAVGGCIGVLVIFAVCLNFSINQRRRIFAQRSMRDRDRQVDTQSFHSDVSGDPPFLPRYFPRTLSNAPPPYVGPAEECAVARQSDSSSIEMYHQKASQFQSTPSHPAAESMPPFVTHDREPSDLPPPFSAVSSPPPPVHTSAMARTVQQIPPREHTEDTEPAT